MSKVRIIISGGGTGGHIFPAIAIANALKKLRSDVEILFVGALGKMEMEKVPAAGYRIVGLNIAGINRSNMLKNLAFPIKLIGSLLKALKIIKEFKPNVVVGVGGFASGPVMYAASTKGIPTVIQEQNSYAGITNKILGKKAKKVCVAYDGMDKFFPAKSLIRTGNPVRQDILNLEGKREEGQKTFKLDPSKKTLLVIGGSLGARSINLAVKSHIEDFKAADVQVVWQTGKLFIDEAKKAVADANATNFFVSDFIYTMDQAYAVADVVLSRAGASSISELCIVGKPSVLVPFPFAAEDHQTKNAQALVDNDAAILVPDNKAGEAACQEALRLLNDSAACEKLSTNIKKLALPNADEQIAREILRIASEA
ncbi:MAG: undecaprenyldiphospho-muramoylpentapeptide beta-N-acetylglucosaminyltransferase [Bacteroidota bacterium]|jgi:UDP-N-acetylglucosamine--N-acetylmuramyl-(pentapeptide) pyrophosphoryl-undecaprenol N-acetylglucosamine transferase